MSGEARNARGGGTGALVQQYELGDGMRPDGWPETFVSLDDYERLRNRLSFVISAAENYMSQFGQGLEAEGIPYTDSQIEADGILRATMYGTAPAPPNRALATKPIGEDHV